MSTIVRNGNGDGNGSVVTRQTTDDWSAGYIAGYADREKESRERSERMRALIREDMERARSVAIEIAENIREEGIHCDRIYLRMVGIGEFAAKLFVPIDEYLEPSFGLAYRIARKVCRENEVDGFQFHYSFVPSADNINENALFSEDYGYRLIRKAEEHGDAAQ